MHNRDWFFLGAFLVTMHYLKRSEPAARLAPSEEAEPQPRHAPAPPSATPLPRMTYDSAPHCPRYPLHYIRSRADGALWCYECDSAYFSGFGRLAAAA